MIKQLSFAITIFFSSISIACSNGNHTTDISSKNSATQQEKINVKDLELIKKYNEILKKISTDDFNTVQNELRDFIPEALTISNKKERNLVLMNIYTQTKMYPEALSLNKSLLKDNPNNVNAQKFQCLLLKTLNEPDSNIKRCYMTLSTILKDNLDTLKSTDPIYKYQEWSYYAAMLHAGNLEYQKKLKFLIASEKNEESQRQFETMYEAEMSEQILPK